MNIELKIAIENLLEQLDESGLPYIFMIDDDESIYAQSELPYDIAEEFVQSVIDNTGILPMTTSEN